MLQKKSPTEIKIAVSISTIEDRIIYIDPLLESLSNQSQLPDQVIIICQRVTDKSYILNYDIIDKYPKLNIVLIADSFSGLSRSRNIALAFADATHLLTADDDLVYPFNAIENVRLGIADFPTADAITFQIALKDRPNYLFKRYRVRPFRHNVLTALRVSSAELVLNLDSIRRSTWYDTDFGLGSKWKTGEENIFITDLVRQKKFVQYIPQILSYHDEHSSGYELNTELLIDKGAMFARIFGITGVIFSIYFSIIKSPKKRFFNAYKSSNGAISYLIGNKS